MKRNKRYSILALLLLAIPSVWAQDVAPVRNILQELQTDVPGRGIIRIYQSPAIAAVVHMQTGRGVVDGGNFQTLQGFRVQVYSGNAANSKSIAADRAAQVRAQFPDLESQTIFNAPFWRVQVGNFVTREEAQAFLDRLKEAFPSFGKSMYIVRTTVKVPL